MRKLFILSASLFVLSAHQAQGDATIYWDFETGFNPSTVVISPDESVTWWNYDPYGFDVTITVGGVLSHTLTPYHGWLVTFPYAGMYDFEDDNGESGTVVVNIPPSVTITNPVNNAVFTAPATFVVQATASDDQGVSYVEFFLDSGAGPESLGYDYDAPYSVSVTDLAVGNYTLTATVSDSYSQSSDSISITVNNSMPSISLSSPRFAGNQFLFDVTGLTVGKTNVVEYCTNLSIKTWTAIATNTATSTARTVTNAPAVGPRFYRIYQRP